MFSIKTKDSFSAPGKLCDENLISHCAEGEKFSSAAYTVKLASFVLETSSLSADYRQAGISKASTVININKFQLGREAMLKLYRMMKSNM